VAEADTQLAAVTGTPTASGVSVVSAAAERYGRLDILVNNAAAPQGLDRHDIEEVPVEVWDQVIRVNLRGTYLMCRFAVPLMRSQRFGRIINISSMAGVVAAPRSTAYSASKAGVLGGRGLPGLGRERVHDRPAAGAGRRGHVTVPGCPAGGRPLTT
jgi:3-oxoacyl-[acyl-carrier protein] reductase